MSTVVCWFSRGVTPGEISGSGRLGVVAETPSGVVLDPLRARQDVGWGDLESPNLRDVPLNTATVSVWIKVPPVISPGMNPKRGD